MSKQAPQHKKTKTPAAKTASPAAKAAPKVAEDPHYRYFKQYNQDHAKKMRALPHGKRLAVRVRYALTRLEGVAADLATFDGTVVGTATLAVTASLDNLRAAIETLEALPDTVEPLRKARTAFAVGAKVVIAKTKVEVYEKLLPGLLKEGLQVVKIEGERVLVNATTEKGTTALIIPRQHLKLALV